MPLWPHRLKFKKNMYVYDIASPGYTSLRTVAACQIGAGRVTAYASPSESAVIASWVNSGAIVRIAADNLMLKATGRSCWMV